MFLFFGFCLNFYFLLNEIKSNEAVGSALSAFAIGLIVSTWYDKYLESKENDND